MTELECYDAGYLNDFGGGNVGWWQDYIRAELERAQDHYQQQVDGMFDGKVLVPVEILGITEFALRRLQFDTPKNGTDYEAITNALNAVLAASQEKCDVAE
jgi:hypothetical protein